MTDHRYRGATRPAALAVGFLLAACSATGATPSPSAIAQEPTASGTPSVAVMPTPVQSVDLPTPEPPMAQPPAASIAVDGGDPVVGELGSFTWQNSGSDSPWLDGNPIHVGSGETLTVTLAEPVAIEIWTASRVEATTLESSSAVGLGEGSVDPVAFAAPPRGTWSVNVNVWFVDNLGSASYYWLVEVD